MTKDVAKVALAVGAFGLVHSLLAGRRAKAASRRAVGPDVHDGLYRLAYNATSVAGLAAVAVYAGTRRTGTVYHANGPGALALHAGQAAGAGVVVWAAYHAGVGKLSGVGNAAGLLAGRPEPMAEGQGPAPEELEAGTVGGPFRHVRHPLNVGFLLICWCAPRMTVSLLAFNLAMTAYAAIGSKLTERRMLATYGERYRRFRDGVPFLVPQLQPAGAT